MKPLALDLCCGLGGWARGLMDAGWRVVGVDIHPEFAATYPGTFLAADVRGLHWTGERVDLVVASPPCQEFSYRAMPWTRARALPPPDTSIWEACVSIAREIGAPLILENVKGAQKYMGRAAWHWGSYYIWGDVPALWPIPAHRCAVKVGGQKHEGEYRLTEGVKLSGQDWSRHKRTGEVSPHWNMQRFKQRGSGAEWFDRGIAALPSRSSRRREASALIAMIPYPLALYIGQVFHPAREKSA